jgi:hypothetical protein
MKDDGNMRETDLLYRCHCGYLKQPEDGMRLSTVRCSLCCCPMRQTEESQSPDSRCLFTSVGDR